MQLATPLRLGVLGCANIARQFVRDVQPSGLVRVDAVASRDAAKAAAFAAEFGVPRHVDSYQTLLCDPALDAIYLPLPNSLHAHWAILAAAAGKHVLCEKPLALSRVEAEAMFDAARRHGVLLFEAYPFSHQPQLQRLDALLADGSIGQVRSMQVAFGFLLQGAADNIRLRPDTGGGALLDAGSYALSLIRRVMGEAPCKVQAHSSWIDSGVDISTSATLFWADGRRAQLQCAMNTAYHRHAVIAGSAGSIETEFLNHTAARAGDNPWGYVPSQLRVRRGSASSQPYDVIDAPTGSGFLFEAEAFARLLRERDSGAAEQAMQASLDIAATLDALAQSARSGQPVELA